MPSRNVCVGIYWRCGGGGDDDDDHHHDDLTAMELDGYVCTCFRVRVVTTVTSLSSWIISLTIFGANVTNLNEPPRALAALHYSVG